METRKRRHIDVCLSEAVDYQTVTTGLERYRLPYNALTQTDLGSVELATVFLGARLRAPVLIGPMTGGAELSGTINRNLAAAAQKLGIGMMLGSQRIMLDNESASASFRVRDVAPDVLLIGNIGLTQLTEQTVPGTRHGAGSCWRQCPCGAYQSAAGSHAAQGRHRLLGFDRPAA